MGPGERLAWRYINRETSGIRPLLPSQLEPHLRSPNHHYDVLARFQQQERLLETGARLVLPYWFTPLARKPPSTASMWPVTKLAASEERNTAAPTNSSTFPKRRMGVRNRNSLPR